MSEPTGRELELHNYLLAHGAKRVSNVAHVFSIQAMEERPFNVILISAKFWSERHGEHFWFDTFLSCNLFDDPDMSIETLAGFVLRQAADVDEVGPPQ